MSGSNANDGTKVVNIAGPLTPGEFDTLVAPSPDERLLMAFAGAMDRALGLADLERTVAKVEERNRG